MLFYPFFAVFFRKSGSERPFPACFRALYPYFYPLFPPFMAFETFSKAVFTMLEYMRAYPASMICEHVFSCMFILAYFASMLFDPHSLRRFLYLRECFPAIPSCMICEHVLSCMAFMLSCYMLAYFHACFASMICNLFGRSCRHICEHVSRLHVFVHDPSRMFCRRFSQSGRRACLHMYSRRLYMHIFLQYQYISFRFYIFDDLQKDLRACPFPACLHMLFHTCEHVKFDIFTCEHDHSRMSFLTSFFRQFALFLPASMKKLAMLRKAHEIRLF